MNERMKEILVEVEKDPRNRDYTERGIYPIVQISENAKILIVGQAPGRIVEETKIPFNDKSGDTLRSWLGMTREVFYSEKMAIMPMDFYYPGKGKTGDLPPRKFIAGEYHQEILTLMLKVELTILIGQYAIKYYLKNQMKENLTETVRNYQEYLPKYFPIVHPSPLNFRWQAKNQWFEKDVVPVLQKIVETILEK